MKIVAKIWEIVTAPFTRLAVHLDESRRENLDGSWDKYWERKNLKMRKLERRKKVKTMQVVIDRLAEAYDAGRINRWELKNLLLTLVLERKIPKGSEDALFDLIVG